jgi:hypothetical protein
MSQVLPLKCRFSIEIPTSLKSVTTLRIHLHDKYSSPMINTLKSGIRFVTVLAIFATSIHIAPTASAISMGPIYDGTSGDVACLTDGEPTGFFTITDNVVTAQESCNGVVDIPSGVLSIGGWVFMQSRQITHVTIPDSVRTIGDGAFFQKSSLTSVSIGSGVTRIGRLAFSSTGLASLIIPSSITSLGESVFSSIPANTFSYCGRNITSSQLARAGIFSKTNSCAPSIGTLYSQSSGSGDAPCSTGFFTIVSNAVVSHQDCAGSAIIPMGVTSINEDAFYYDTLLTSVTISDSVRTIAKGAFENTINMVTISLGSGVVTIGERSFAQAAGLTSIIIPNSTTTIGPEAFYYIFSLSSVTIGGRVSSIGNSAFAYSAITSLVIPNSVISIGFYAFGGNNSLTSLTIGRRVEEIGAFAFFNTNSLTEYSYCAALLSEETLESARLSSKSVFCDPNAPGDLLDEPIDSQATASSENISAAVAAAIVQREAEIRTARAEIVEVFKSSKTATAESFAQAEIRGITKSNIDDVNAEIALLPVDSRTSLNEIVKIARKFEVVGDISTENVIRVFPKTFVEVGLIPADSPNKCLLAMAVRKLAPSDRDSYAEIKAAIDAEMAVINARAIRLAALLAR